MTEITRITHFQGQFGTNTGKTLENEPVNLTKLLDIKTCIDVACQDDVTAAVIRDGSLLLWGSSTWDVFEGNSSVNSYIRTPFKTCLNAEACKVAIGSWHIAVIVRKNQPQGAGIPEESQAILSEDRGLFNHEIDMADRKTYDACDKNIKKSPTYKKTRKMGVAQKDFSVPQTSCSVDSNGLLLQLVSLTVEDERTADVKEENESRMGSSVKSIKNLQKNGNKGAELDFVIDRVMRENAMTFAPLKLNRPQSMASFYIRRPERKSSNQNRKKISDSLQRRSYAGMQRPRYASPVRSEYSYISSNGLRDEYRRQRDNSMAFESKTQEEKRTDCRCIMSTWNTETLLDMTTRSNAAKEANERNAKKIGFIKSKEPSFYGRDRTKNVSRSNFSETSTYTLVSIWTIHILCRALSWREMKIASFAHSKAFEEIGNV